MQHQLFQCSHSSSCLTNSNITAGDLVSRTLEFGINSSSNKIGNNERQWEVGGEFLSANLVSDLGEISQNYSFNYSLNDY